MMIFLLAAGKVPAQDTPSLKSAVDQSSVLVGEPVRLGVDVVSPSGTAIVLPVIDSVAHFEFLSPPKIDSLTEGANTHYRMEWKLTSFDSGVFKIPALSVHIGNKNYRSDTIAIAVGYGKTDSLKEYHDIKGIIDLANPAVKYIPWALGALTLLTLVAVWFSAAREGFLEAPAKNEKGKPRTVRTPYDEAIAALDELRKMALPDAAAIKRYYSSMNDVMRVYLSRTRGFASMEKTNEEVILYLLDLGLDRSLFTRFASLLRIVDFVKFAKYLPDMPDHVKNIDTMRDAIRIINEIRK